MDTGKLQEELQAERRNSKVLLQHYVLARSVLGENGEKLFNKIDQDHILDIKIDWGPDALELSGEERAKIALGILDAKEKTKAP